MGMRQKNPEVKGMGGLMLYLKDLPYLEHMSPAAAFHIYIYSCLSIFLEHWFQNSLK